MNLEKGLISVVMSNYNTHEEYLRPAIESILNQTYRNFEFIIIDDCSTDNSLQIIESYSDKRIKIIKNEQNLGITKSLNKGLAVAKGEFIARMDSDDIAFPTRFEKQIEFLKSNPEHIVCGTGIELIGEWEKKHSNKYICRTIPKKYEFQINLLFGNFPNIAHPTAMFNHRLLKKHNILYDEKYPLSQDYKMWISCSKYYECANLPETLLYYRVHKQAVSTAKQTLQRNVALQIMQEQLNKLNIELSNEYEDIHMGLLFGRKKYNPKIKLWIKTIINQNKKYKIYDHKKLKKVLWSKWTETVYFEIAKAKTLNKIKALLTLPLFCYPDLLNIYNKRSTKKRK